MTDAWIGVAGAAQRAIAQSLREAADAHDPGSLRAALDLSLIHI